MVVQHNLQAMNANRMFNVNTKTQSKSTEKLSSGYKINRAADDAAGLSISEKMRKQIRGLSQASLNAQDGISAVQTAEGALNEVQDMLQRMNELAVKAGNGTMSEDDRTYIQNEIDQLVTEIDRVSETTKFNESYLLKGVDDTETIETPASVKVTYNDKITGDSVMSWNNNGTDTLWATKDGQSVEITKDNYNKYLELGSKKIIDKVEIKENMKLYDANGQQYDAASLQAALETDPETKIYANTNGKGTMAATISSVSTGAVATSVAMSITYTSPENEAIAKAQNQFTAAVSTTGITVKVSAGSVSYELNGYNIDKYGNVYAAGDDETIIANIANMTATANVHEGSDVIKITTGTEAKAASPLADADTYTITYKDQDTINTKDGYTIYKQAPGTGQFGDQKPDQLATESDLLTRFSIASDLLLDKDGNMVSAEKLGDYFKEDGSYKGGLYKINDQNARTEIGAEQIDDYVVWDRTEASSEEKAIKKALHFSLQVGADTSEQNKISIDIECMNAKSLGVAGLKVDGKDSTNADAAVDVIAEAIQKVSTQRSALGAVQNRLEHTINNLDNVVENTTSAESAIRDTDMATEMVKYSNNNILAQAGQAMLAQANQANQGVLSLLG